MFLAWQLSRYAGNVGLLGKNTQKMSEMRDYGNAVRGVADCRLHPPKAKFWFESRPHQPSVPSLYDLAPVLFWKFWKGKTLISPSSSRWPLKVILLAKLNSCLNPLLSKRQVAIMSCMYVLYERRKVKCTIEQRLRRFFFLRTPSYLSDFLFLVFIGLPLASLGLPSLFFCFLWCRVS